MEPGAIADTGCTGHYFLDSTPCSNKRPTDNPINVQLPNGHHITSTHVAELPWEQLPEKARTVHIFNDLAANALLSIGTLCDSGCKAIFDAETVRITYQDQPFLDGNRDHNGLWRIKVTPATAAQPKEQAAQPEPETTSNILTVPTKQTATCKAAIASKTRRRSIVQWAVCNLAVGVKTQRDLVWHAMPD